MSERALTLDEHDRLAPLLAETEMPVRVATTSLTVAGRAGPMAGEAVGRWPNERWVLLGEDCFEQFDDEQVLGLLAHEVGHHDGYHGVLQGVVRLGVAVIGVTVLMGLLVGGVIGGVLVERWLVAGLSVVGMVVVALCLLLGSAALSRHFEHDADRRGADLLGSTEPLEAWYEPGADRDDASRWREWCSPWPHPAESLAALREYSG